ncbi:hypothetical protein PWP93_25245 [Paraburkholderia sp. A1RI-2L]|uniref:hypothetical protein n=1 Tax=Paraburkholderia sp. A1RI-2L TaxID=3028367 RepID=UPI003B7891F0
MHRANLFRGWQKTITRSTMTRSPLGGISLLDYPAIRRWTDRVKMLPGFIVMAGMFPGSASLEDNQRS